MEASYRIEIFSRRGLRGKRWYSRIVARNGQTVYQSEGYHNRDDCRETAGHVRASLIEAEIVDV